MDADGAGRFGIGKGGSMSRSRCFLVLSMVTIACGVDGIEAEPYDSTADNDLARTLAPAADAFVRSGSSASINYGARANLKADLDDAGRQTYSYLRFAVPSFTTLTKATLRLYVSDGATSAPDLLTVANTTWSESTITWNNKPALGTLVRALGSVPTGSWLEIDVTSIVRSGQTLSLALRPVSTDSFIVNSKEAASERPQLVISTSTCGDAVCDAGETCSTCAQDCGSCSAALPGVLEAEAYRTGGEGIGYHDTTAGNFGMGTCRVDDVDMKPSGSACTVGWFERGEWLAYDVDIASTGTYVLEARVACGLPGGSRFHVEADGVDVTGPITVPSTGSWDTLTSLQAVATLPAGSHVLKVVNDLDFFDLDLLKVSASGPCADGSCVTINVGASIQSLVNANPTGTKFLIKTGTHRQQSVLPKAGNAFYCEPGAVLDGENVSVYAFRNSGLGPNNVTIQDCRITRYVPPAQMGAIRAGGGDFTDLSSGWRVENCEIDHNANIGLRLGNTMIVRGNYLHHNGTMGMGGVGNDILVEDNEIAYNNPTATGLGFESGGTKFVKTNRLIVRGNFCHHNMGPCLWADIANRSFLFEQNLVEDNLQDGIAIEISYNGVIRNNTVRRNGLDDDRADNWLWGAGISISASGGTGIEIYGNRLEGNAHGIALVQQNRGSGFPNEPTGIDAQMYVQNVYAHDNTVILQTVAGHVQPGSFTAAGGVDDTGTNGLYSRNNRFENNTYSLNGRAYPFAWASAYRTAVQWRGYGHDDTGTFTP
jgi:parallel beta-helix repeat protein